MPSTRWTSTQIREDIKEAVAAFRHSRFQEPSGLWLREVANAKEEFTKLFELYGVARPQTLTAQTIPDVIQAKLFDALRYLSGPPVSADDLKTLAEVRSLRLSSLRADLGAAQRVLDALMASVDGTRFRWLEENRVPSPDEENAAILISAFMLASQRLLTERRNIAKREQEEAVRREIKSRGFRGERVRKISTYAQFPSAGVVSENEVRFGPKKADTLVRLWDDTMMPIECKVSNSEVNSYKRLNHETVEKYNSWTEFFGSGAVLPAAVLAGVYKPQNVIDAQAAGLTIFWSHRISDLGDFVEATRK